MFSRLSNNAVNPSQDFTNAMTGRGGVRGARGGRGRGGGEGHLASNVLRRAGLVDEDAGMRDASAAGPSRTGAGGKRRGGADANGASSSRMRIDDESARSSRTRNARNRANPMGSRPARNAGGRSAGGAPNDEAGKAVGAAIRGVAQGGKQGGGRVPGGGGDLPKTNNTIQVLKRFLGSRWNAEAKFLNLEDMQKDPILAEQGIKPPGVAGAPREVGNVIWKLCKELYPDVLTISLARNELRSLVPVSTLAHFLPNLQNLSLQGNDLKWTKDLDTLSGRKGRLSALRELILVGNPVYDNAVAAGNEEGYRREVIGKFENLKMLDLKDISTTEASFAALPTAGRGGQAGSSAAAAQVPLRNFPIQIRQGFADEEAGRIIPQFLSKFFELYDNNRALLREVYAPAATFTYYVNMSVPPRARAAGFLHSMPNQTKLNFDTYVELGSRNLMRLQGQKARTQAIHRGVPSILSTLEKLPRTAHPLTDASKFVVDAWVMPNVMRAATATGGPGGPEKPEAVLFIAVHGEFTESPAQGIRSFDRTFIVAPAPPGSPAANAGWPCVILSDQLTLRHYSSHKAWALDALPTGEVDAASAGPAAQAGPVNGIVPGPGQAPAVVAAPAPGLDERQHNLSLQLAARTGLTYPFAVQCLSENGWNPTQAMNNFHALKASNAIPAEAFASA